MAVRKNFKLLLSKYIKRALVNSKFRFDVESFEGSKRLRTGRVNIDILCIILKEIIWRFRFNLNFSKIFRYCDFMSNFR